MSDISVVITAYNLERYIERAIASVLAQKEVDVEIIVVDDCSTDNTWSLISAMTHACIRAIRLKRNGGPSTARNAGFAAATAPWIAVLDGDDAMEPERLCRMLARARREKADIVVDNLTVLRERDGMQYPLFASRTFSRLGTMSLAAFIDGNCFFLGERAYGYLKPIFSADFLRQHGLAYDTKIRMGEDYFLLAEALACGAHCAVEATPGYQYTVRVGSLSRQLKLSDIDRLIAGDRAFVKRCVLPADARDAQRRRTSSLRDARYFLQLINALKARDLRVALKVMAAYPPAARHLWRPLCRAARRLLTFKRRQTASATRDSTVFIHGSEAGCN
jgi:succinoglycan biosynthesis protein ExoO